MLRPLLWALWLLSLLPPTAAQTEAAAPRPEAPRTAGTATADLYRRLGNLSLDPTAVYKIRDASIDREDIHLSLSDGTIAFTREVNGRITGALFEGEGEVLIVPPDYTERHSLSMFSGSAVLNERFALAYFRFADDSFIEGLNPFLRPAEDARAFIAKHDALALSLSESDALRTLIGVTYAPKASRTQYAGEFLYARIAGEKLGSIEVAFDPMLPEQVSVRALAFTDRGRYYDLWMTFPMQSVRKLQGAQEPSPASRIVEITDYKVRMDVRPPTDLTGTATLTLRTFQSGPRALAFELSRFLKLSRVEWEAPGRAPVNLDFLQNEALEGSQLARRGNDTVTIVFPEPLAAGETLQVKFTYAGSVMSEAGGGLLYVGARGTWYPNRGPAMSNYDLEFRHPPEWRLLATGKRVSSAMKDGMQELRFVSEHPVPLAGFNLGKYVSTEATAGSTKLEVYSARGVESDFARPQVAPLPSLSSRDLRRLPPSAPIVVIPDPSQKADAIARRAADMVDSLSPRLGAFPFTSLSLTQLPGPNSQGWPGLVFLSSYVFLDKEARERSRLGAADRFDWVFDHVMTEHEVAHQWWGNNVFWDSYRDQWLMEGLSNYCALLRLEPHDPVLFRKLLDQYRTDLLQKPLSGDDRPYLEAGPVRLGIRLNSSRFVGAYDPVVYGRGTWLLHMLREIR